MKKREEKVLRISHSQGFALPKEIEKISLVAVSFSFYFKSDE